MAKRLASLCTFVTSGQVASIVRELAVGRLLVHRRRDAVGGEDDERALGHLVGLVDEDRAAFAQGLDDVLVVDDLLAHVDGRAVELQRLLHGDHRAVHAGAVAARLREQHAFGGAGLGDRRGTGGLGSDSQKSCPQGTGCAVPASKSSFG